MEEKEFKKFCPNLYDSIKSTSQLYEIYGIRFKSHTPLTYYEIRDRVEDFRNRLFYKTVVGIQTIYLN